MDILLQEKDAPKNRFFIARDLQGLFNSKQKQLEYRLIWDIPVDVLEPPEVFDRAPADIETLQRNFVVVFRLHGWFSKTRELMYDQDLLIQSGE